MSRSPIAISSVLMLKLDSVIFFFTTRWDLIWVIGFEPQVRDTGAVVKNIGVVSRYIPYLTAFVFQVNCRCDAFDIAWIEKYVFCVSKALDMKLAVINDNHFRRLTDNR